MNATLQANHAQQRAADPDVSAFAPANAGSGKTSVLTARAARLLLAGARPEHILCITYTRAAAAEMSDRLFRLLGQWSHLDDEALGAALRGLIGADTVLGAEALDNARRLFARALETPGGLKIETIHGFCDSVLKRFPIEAGVPPGFALLAETEAASLLTRAVDAALEDSRAAAPIERLVRRFSPSSIAPTIMRFVAARARCAAGAGPSRLSDQFGIDPEMDERAARAAACALVSADEMRAFRALFAQGLSTAQKFAHGPMTEFIVADSIDARFEALSSFFFIQTGGVRKTFGDKTIKKLDPTAAERLGARAAAFEEAVDRVRAAAHVADSEAVQTLAALAAAQYEKLKSARAALDYDDLIARALSLLTAAEEQDWVRYKLDRGVDHILLDEAQDTSPDQWRIIESLIGEFTAGQGARPIRRTFFAVGDQKQSIYAFQGADARLFSEKRAVLGKRLSESGGFVDQPLTVSFRSTAAVLDFVDAAFEEEGARGGLVDQDDEIRHVANRGDEPGLVELWPAVPVDPDQEQDVWDAPLDARSSADPETRLADHVAATLKSWFDHGERLDATGARIRPGDVILLVQSRSRVFYDVIRALGRAGVPVAGPDRLALAADPAVEDMLSFARAVSLLTDDLSLAETLKSPFFGFDDEALFSLAHDRRGTLREALAARADLVDAETALASAGAVARAEGAYAFFSHILETGAPSGRKRLFARLGEASRDAIDELLRQALDFERVAPRSLPAFVAAFAGEAIEIKRELSKSADAVRVMTVHGAKGLEAPVVFLLDATRMPLNSKVGEPIDVAGALALEAPVSESSRVMASAKEEKSALSYEEYRRKFYVAATRARDRLYICGAAKNNEPDESAPLSRTSWRRLAIRAMERLGAEIAPFSGWRGEKYVYRTGRAPSPPMESESLEITPSTPPDWALRPAPAESRARVLTPSRLSSEDAAVQEGSAYSPVEEKASARYVRGLALHALLERLPALPIDSREAAADLILARRAPQIAPHERAQWKREAFSVLDDPAMAELFAPGGRAEVPLCGVIGEGGSARRVAGVVDRLAVLPDRVLIVDFKSNRPPPVRPEDAPIAYVRQLAAYRALLHAIYPERTIECALLWTFAPALTIIPAIMLDHALASLFEPT